MSLEKLYGYLSNSWQRRVEGPLLEALLPGHTMESLNVDCVYCIACFDIDYNNFYNL